MARSRNIKPGFFSNELLVEAEYGTRLLFIGLWTIADRAGRLEDRPKRIKMQLFPADDLDVELALCWLHGHGFIERYRHGDELYIQVVNFHKHQTPHHREAESTIPAPDGYQTNTVPTLDKPQASPGKDQDKPVPSRSDSLIPDTHDSLNPDSESHDSAALHPFVLLETLCDELGQDISVLSAPEKNKQLAAAKRLVSEQLSESDLRRIIRWLRAQTWRDGGIDLMTVQQTLSRWKLDGKPDKPKPKDIDPTTLPYNHPRRAAATGKAAIG